MLVFIIILIIIAISLNYFKITSTIMPSSIIVQVSTSKNTERVDTRGQVSKEMMSQTKDLHENLISLNLGIYWKRIAVILLICTLPLLWESRIQQDIYIYNGLLLLTMRLNLVTWLLFITGLSLITICIQQSIQTSFKEQIIFTICAILGGIILSSATDFLTILLGLELQSYSVYILAASYRNFEPSEAAGLKYFLLGALSSALVFMGLAILYAYSGSTNLDFTLFTHILTYPNLQNNINSYIYSHNDYILPYIGIILLFAGLCWKVAAAPVQAWSIDVYDAVPTRTTAILSLIPKIALFTILMRLINMLSTHNTINVQYSHIAIKIVIFVIGLSLIVGAFAGLFQPRIKRLLAYSSVLNVGFILMGTLLSNSNSFNIPLFYIIQYIITTAAIWLCLVNIANIYVIQNDKEITLTSQLQGIHTKPNLNSFFNKDTTIFAICLSALILSTAGIPPMAGFFAKYSVILLAVQSGFTSLALIAVLASIISTVYYLNVIRAIWSRSSIQHNNLNISSIKSFDEKTSILSKHPASNLKDIVESTLLVSFYSLIIILYLLQYSVITVLISL